MCLMPYANNKGADQPAHPPSLISPFMCTCYIQSFKNLAEQAGLNLTYSKIPEDTFSRDVAHLQTFSSLFRFQLADTGERMGTKYW